MDPGLNRTQHGAGEMERIFFFFFLSFNSRTTDRFMSCKWKELDFSIRHSHLRASCHPLCAASLKDATHVLGTKTYYGALYSTGP